MESVKRKRVLALALAALFVVAACDTGSSTQAPTTGGSTPAPGASTPAPSSSGGSGPTGLDVPIGDPSRADQEYVWISNASNLPLFVERVYPGLDSARKALNVKVRIAGPSSVDLAAFLTTVDAECTKNPAGVIVVGGWDDSLATEVDKCIDKQVPTVVTDGDLAMSKRLTYLGTDWYNLGYVHGQYQCRYHQEAGLTSGKIGTISFLAAANFRAARQGLRDALAAECPGVQVVADEESGTNVEQVASNTAAIMQANPDLTGMVGFDSEAGPGIVRAVTEAGKAGQIIVTSNEAGREFMNSIKDGTVKMINMEKYETMDFFAVAYLYTFHNDIIRNLNMDHWLQNPLPAIGDSGLIIITQDNVDTILAATDPNQQGSGPTGLDVPIGDPSRADQEYVWISNASNLPLFVERVYPGLDSARKALNVKVRIAGPSSVDLAAFLTTVDAECTKNPAGVIVVGGWDDSLATEVDKCIDKQVPTVVTDGDLAMSKRLTYLGTNWYNLGYVHGQYQCRYHQEAGLTSGKIGTISFLAAANFRAARQGLRDALAAECPGVQVVADEESGTNVEQVASNTAAIMQANPDLTGMVGFDSEAGPGIVRAVTEAGKAGQIIVTSNEAGREFMNSIKDGTVKMINMEKYETMDFFAVMYLYTFHNDIIRNLNMDHWLQNPLPAIGDSGLIIITQDNVDTILAATAGSQ